MKTKIVINVETKNMLPLYEDGLLQEKVMSQIDQELHNSIVMWLRDNTTQENIENLITQNFYSVDVISEIENLEDVCDLKVTFQIDKNEEEVTTNILRFVDSQEEVVEKKEEETKMNEEEIEELIPGMEKVDEETDDEMDDDNLEEDKEYEDEEVKW